MKYNLLLLEDVINQGRKGDIISVAAGFARNFLLPSSKAVLVSKSNLKIRERLQKERSEQSVKDKYEFEKLASKIRGLMFDVVVKVDPDGNLYGSVKELDIVDILLKSGISIDKHYVILPHHIKKIGVYQINLRFPEGVECSIGLTIKPDREIKVQKEELNHHVEAEDKKEI